MIVRSAVGPPHSAAFPERAFYRLRLEARSYSLNRIRSITFRAFRGHQLVDQSLVRFLIESRVT